MNFGLRNRVHYLTYINIVLKFTEKPMYLLMHHRVITCYITHNQSIIEISAEVINGTEP